jgi:hypothetical protein
MLPMWVSRRLDRYQPLAGGRGVGLALGHPGQHGQPAMSQVFSGPPRRARDASRERTCGSQPGPQPVSHLAAAWPRG